MAFQRYIVESQHEPERLIDFIAYKTKLSKKEIKRSLDARVIYVNKQRVWIASFKLSPDDVIEFKQVENKVVNNSKLIIHKDEDIVVVNKPAGVLSNGQNSLETTLRLMLKSNTVFAAHRLDRDTSGLLIYVRNQRILEDVIKQFKNKTVKKIYHALVLGEMKHDHRTLNKAIDNQEALTQVKVIKKREEASLVECYITTGRKHQIRIHLAEIGHPLLGESEHYRRSIRQSKIRKIDRVMLHAQKISFNHPRTGALLTFEAPYPEDFTNVAQKFGLVQGVNRTRIGADRSADRRG